MKTKRQTNVAAYLLLAMLALMVFSLCIMVKWMGDDIYFAFNLGSDDWYDRIQSLDDIVESQSAYYMTRNGRFITHCFVQFFCGIAGKWAFALCNAVVWMTFVVMLARVAGIDWRRHAGALFMFIALSFVCLRTQLTPPCQINYIWAFAAGLLSIDWFLNPRQGKWWALVMVAFSFVAGWGQESFSSGVAAAMWIYALLHIKSMKPSQWGILLAFTAGMLCLCLAPGNFTKLGTLSSLRATPVAMAYYMRATYLLLAVILVVWLTRKASLLQIYKENAFWFNALFFMVVFNLLVRVYCNRQLFGIEVMSIIIVVRLLHHHMGDMKSLRAVFMGILLVLLVLVVIDDVNTIHRRKALAADIESLYEKSSDGIVYCDIVNKDFCYRDEDPMWSLNYWALSLMSRMWMSQGATKPLEWRPAAVKDLLDKPLESQVIRLGDEPGTFMLIYAKGDTACTFEIFEERKYGPIAVAHYTKTSKGDKPKAPDGTEVIQGDHFQATIHRHNDAFDRYIDARLLP